MPEQQPQPGKIEGALSSPPHLRSRLSRGASQKMRGDNQSRSVGLCRASVSLFKQVVSGKPGAVNLNDTGYLPKARQ